MKKLWVSVLMIGLAVGVSAPAFAGSIPSNLHPTGTVFVDTFRFDVLFQVTTSGEFEIPFQQFQTAAGDRVFLSGLVDPDPSIGYSVGITDFGVASTFILAFSTPIVPVAGPNVVFASIGGSFTDFTGDGISFTPFGGPLAQVSEVSLPLTNMGVDVGPAFGPTGPATAGAMYGYGPFTAGPQAGPISGTGWTLLSTKLGFTGSGGGDMYALNGFASIDAAPVPEPASLLLLGSGLAGLGAWRRYRRRA